VHLDFRQQGRLMVERLLVLIEEVDRLGEELQPELVVRGSTAEPRL
jgi:DNA-binding LacI/PurR family transcriptional regulator